MPRPAPLLKIDDRIVGVVDVLGGVAVAPPPGAGGNRSEYQIVDAFGGDVRRIAVAMGKLGIRGIYVADLDALGGLSESRSSSNAGAIEDFGKVEGITDVWVDAGRRLVPGASFGSIVSSEAFGDVASAKAAIENRINLDRMAISLDFRDGEFWGDDWPEWKRWSSETNLTTFVIDVSAVGECGVRTASRCRELRRSGFKGTLISGGGVDGNDDVQRLIDAGADRVMVGRRILQRLTQIEPC